MKELHKRNVTGGNFWKLDAALVFAG